MSWDVSIPNTFAKEHIKSYIASSSNTLMPSEPQKCFCLGASGWCLGVTWWCLEVSGWCARVSGDVSIPNPFARDYVRSDIAFSSNALFYIKLPMSGGIWIRA